MLYTYGPIVIDQGMVEREMLCRKLQPFVGNRFHRRVNIILNSVPLRNWYAEFSHDGLSKWG